MTENLVKLLDVILHDDSSLRRWLDELRTKHAAATERPLVLRTHIKDNAGQQMLALLQQRLTVGDYRAASRLLESIALEPVGTKTAVLRAGFEIMFNLGHSSAAALEQLVGQLKQLSNAYNGKLVVLEYVFYLLTNDFKLHDALDALAMEPRARTLHPRPLDKQTADYIGVLYTAYSGFAWYLDWYVDSTAEANRISRRRAATFTADPDSGGRMSEAAAMLSASQVHALSSQMQSKVKADRAMAAFGKVLQTKGVWDVFVTKHIEMLEYYDMLDEAHDVLQKYCSWCCPTNPNAHRYMYEFLDRHKDPADILAEGHKIAALEVLQKLVPSHELVLVYCKLLLEADMDGCAELCLSSLMAMLDYPCWKNDIRPWKSLADLLTAYSSSARFKKHVVNEWSGRSTWWPQLHFGHLGLAGSVGSARAVTSSAAVEPLSSPSLPSARDGATELLCQKCVTSFYLLGPDNDYLTSVVAAVGSDFRKQLASLLGTRGS